MVWSSSPYAREFRSEHRTGVRKWFWKKREQQQCTQLGLVQESVLNKSNEHTLVKRYTRYIFFSVFPRSYWTSNEKFLHPKAKKGKSNTVQSNKLLCWSGLINSGGYVPVRATDPMRVTLGVTAEFACDAHVVTPPCRYPGKRSIMWDMKTMILYW